MQNSTSDAYMGLVSMQSAAFLTDRRIWLRLLIYPNLGLIFAFFFGVTTNAQNASELQPQQGTNSQSTHVLMPGIVSRHIRDPDWPRTQHDHLATGFSPLVCNMRQAPRVWGDISVGGSLNGINEVIGPDKATRLLVDDSRLRLIDLSGKILWNRPSVGSLIGSGDLRGDGGSYALMSAGPHLTLLDLVTGEDIWKHSLEPAYVFAGGKIADILPEVSGLEAIIVPTHGEEGILISFSADAEPKIVWQRQIVDGDFNERYDHHNGKIEIDLSEPEQPVIWNLRRHRCTGIDARTGERISEVAYEIGGGEKRNYGPMHLGRGKNGQPLACVFGQFVQLHVHAIRLHRDSPNELAWEHYYGEVYKEAAGVALNAHGLVDIDGDGADEMVYSVRDPAYEYRSFVRFRSVDTGEIKLELPDHWCAGTFADVGEENRDGFLAFSAPQGKIPHGGELKVYCFKPSEVPEQIATVADGGTWGPLTISSDSGNELLIREQGPEDTQWLSRFTIANGELQQVARSDAAELLAQPFLHVIKNSHSDQELFLIQDKGEIRGLSWDGLLLWSHPLRGGSASSVSAADLDGDGKAELVAAEPDKQLHVYTCAADGSAEELRSFDHVLGWHTHHPVIYDLQGDGSSCILAAAKDKNGDLVIRANLLDGSQFWETPLEVAADNLHGVVLNAGQFLAKDHSGVAVSLTDPRRIHEGTFLLDGRNGEVLWFKGMHHDGTIAMPFRPNGIPTAYDFDRDGIEEIGMDLLSYMAYLKGKDGDFAYVRHTHNVRSEDAVYGGHLYNTFCPLFRNSSDSKPHWFVTAGFGPFGLMNPDPRNGVWLEDLDYDVPRNIALVDVDGDGELEAGYSALNSTKFVCRDVWTGDIEWTINLPSPTNATTITADFDGDGQGEFFSGRYCIGTNSLGEGEIRWQSPVHLNWPIIADFDGDGEGEIAGGQAGKIVILNNQTE